MQICKIDKNDYGRDLDLLQGHSCLCAWRMLSPQNSQFFLCFSYIEKCDLYTTTKQIIASLLHHICLWFHFLLINIPHSQQLIIVSFRGNDYFTLQENELSSYGNTKHHQQIINAFYWTKEVPPQRCETVQIENKSIVLKVERWVLDLPRKKQHKGILA